MLFALGVFCLTAVVSMSCDKKQVRTDTAQSVTPKTDSQPATSVIKKANGVNEFISTDGLFECWLPEGAIFAEHHPYGEDGGASLFFSNEAGSFMINRIGRIKNGEVGTFEWFVKMQKEPSNIKSTVEISEKLEKFGWSADRLRVRRTIEMPHQDILDPKTGLTSCVGPESIHEIFETIFYQDSKETIQVGYRVKTSANPQAVALFEEMLKRFKLLKPPSK